MRKRARLRYLGCAAVALFPWLPAFGQDKDEVIHKLISRVEALEREGAALKQAAPPEQIVAAPKPESAATEAVIPADAAEPVASSEKRYTFHAYADVGFVRNEDGTPNK